MQLLEYIIFLPNILAVTFSVHHAHPDDNRSSIMFLPPSLKFLSRKANCIFSKISTYSFRFSFTFWLTLKNHHSCCCLTLSDFTLRLINPSQNWQLLCMLSVLCRSFKKNCNNTDWNAKLDLPSVNDPREQKLRVNAAGICGDILKLCKTY